MSPSSILAHPWALALSHVPPAMPTNAQHQSRPGPHEDEIMRFPIELQPSASVRSAPTCRARSAGATRGAGTRPQPDPSRMFTTDVDSAVASLANGHGITKVIFKKDVQFLAAAHARAFAMFDGDAAVSQEGLMRWSQHVDFTDDVVSMGGTWTYEEDQVVPIRSCLIHLTRHLGLQANQECLTSEGKAAVERLAPRFGKADMGVKIVSDIECVNNDPTKDRVSYEIEAKRINVGNAVLEQLNTLIQYQSASADMSLNQNNAVPVKIDWGLPPGRPQKRSGGATLAKAAKMMCQTRRVLLMTWENMIVFELGPAYGDSVRTVSVSPIIRRLDGSINAGILRGSGRLQSSKDGVRFYRDNGVEPQQLKPTYISTLLALALCPKEQAPPGFYPPDSAGRVNRTALVAGQGAAVEDPTIPPVPPLPPMPPAQPRDQGVARRSGGTGRSGGGRSTRSNPTGSSVRPAVPSNRDDQNAEAERAVNSGTSRFSDRSTSEPPTASLPEWLPPVHSVLMPTVGAELDACDLTFTGLDLSIDGVISPNEISLHTHMDAVPRSDHSVSPSSLVVALEERYIGHGELGDVLAGKAYFPAPHRTENSPKDKRRLLQNPVENKPMDVALKLVCSEHSRSGDYDGAEPDEILDMFANEVHLYKFECAAQQGITIPKCYGFFRAPVVFEWPTSDRYIRAARDGEQPDGYVYALLLQRLGESIGTDDGQLTADVDIEQVKRLYDEFHKTGLVHRDISVRHIMHARPSEASTKTGRSKKSRKTAKGGLKYRICDLEYAGLPTEDYTFERERRDVVLALRGALW